MTSLLLLLLACDPHSSLRTAELDFSDPASMEASRGVSLVTTANGEPASKNVVRMTLTTTGVGIDNRAWWLALDHDALATEPGPKATHRALEIDYKVMELDNGTVAAKGVKGLKITRLYNALKDMREDAGPVLAATGEPMDHIQIFSAGDVDARTLKLAMSTARESGYTQIELIGRAGDAFQAPVLDRPVPYAGRPCGGELYVIPHAEQWTVKAIATPAITLGDGCHLDAAGAVRVLDGLADKCQAYWSNWQAQYGVDMAKATPPGQWQCVEARVALGSGSPVRTTLELLDAAQTAKPRVHMGAPRAVPEDLELACAHAVPLEQLDEPQLTVLCGGGRHPELPVNPDAARHDAIQSAMRQMRNHNPSARTAFPQFSGALQAQQFQEKAEIRKAIQQSKEDEPAP